MNPLCFTDDKGGAQQGSEPPTVMASKGQNHNYIWAL